MQPDIKRNQEILDMFINMGVKQAAMDEKGNILNVEFWPNLIARGHKEENTQSLDKIDLMIKEEESEENKRKRL